MTSVIKHDVALMDFVRGWASILVFIHHAAILGGGPALLGGHIGEEAVNLFMLASGFLIFYQASISRNYEGFRSMRGMRHFYTRRFFRIAPAYYAALLAAYLLAEYLGAGRQEIAEVLPSTATSMDRYFIDDLATNLFMHVTFLFGLFPDHVFSTPLPDWSLGLEMEFYLVFPLIFLCYQRHFTIAFILSILFMMAITKAVALMGITYPMPGFLPLKFHNFAAGMALAYLYLQRDTKAKWMIIAFTLLATAYGNHSLFIPLAFAGAIWFLVLEDRFSAPFKQYCQRLFSHWTSKFLADISYSLYIFHLLFMIPFFALMLGDTPDTTAIWLAKTIMLLMICGIVAFFSFRLIEQPAIRLGKKWLER